MERQPALAGHATFEWYPVLTRLPRTAQVSGVDAALGRRRTLLTRDRRTMRTYDLIGSTYELVEEGLASPASPLDACTWGAAVCSVG